MNVFGTITNDTVEKIHKTAEEFRATIAAHSESYQPKVGDIVTCGDEYEYTVINAIPPSLIEYVATFKITNGIVDLRRLHTCLLIIKRAKWEEIQHTGLYTSGSSVYE